MTLPDLLNYLNSPHFAKSLGFESTSSKNILDAITKQLVDLGILSKDVQDKSEDVCGYKFKGPLFKLCTSQVTPLVLIKSVLSRVEEADNNARILHHNCTILGDNYKIKANDLNLCKIELDSCTNNNRKAKVQLQGINNRVDVISENHLDSSATGGIIKKLNEIINNFPNDQGVIAELQKIVDHYSSLEDYQ